jgi:hypothetical protein
MDHLRRSRVAKALTDTGIAASFPEAETRLDAVHICVVVGDAVARTRAGQAAALTAVDTAFKCFGRVTVAMATDAPLLLSFPLGATLAAAAENLGAHLASTPPESATHQIGIGADWLSTHAWQVHCWWDRWLTGVRCEPDATCGDSNLGLSGVFSGALAVRQVFACVLRGPAFRPKDATLSLWAPWDEELRPGPTHFTAPVDLWLVGLGHLGQAYVWNLLTLPYGETRRAILQDDQKLGIENEPTSLLSVRPFQPERKVRLAARWLEAAGWETDLIERRNHGEIRPTLQDPPFLLAGLDDVRPRRILASLGFEYMVDGGIGHGPADFEGLQVRVIPRGTGIDDLWNASEPPKSRDRLLARPAYQALEQSKVGACGAYALAGASVAVPFVGAATGALAVAQLVRLASGQAAGTLVQLGLGAPEMMIDGGRCAAPASFLGGEHMGLYSDSA